MVELSFFTEYSIEITLEEVQEKIFISTKVLLLLFVVRKGVFKLILNDLLRYEFSAVSLCVINFSIFSGQIMHQGMGE